MTEKFDEHGPGLRSEGHEIEVLFAVEAHGISNVAS